MGMASSISWELPAADLRQTFVISEYYRGLEGLCNASYTEINVTTPTTPIANQINRFRPALRGIARRPDPTPCGPCDALDAAEASAAASSATLGSSTMR